MQIPDRIRHLISWLGLAAYLVICLLNLPGVVLCFEKEGQVALEMAINGVCSDTFDSRRQLEQSQAGSAVSKSETCKSCTDVPLSLSNTGPQAPIFTLYQAFAQDIVQPKAIEVVPRYLATAIVTRFPQPPPLRPAIHRFLNTVMLLI